MKHTVAASLALLLSVNSVFASIDGDIDTTMNVQNECKLDVMLTPRPLGIIISGTENHPQVRRIAQDMVDEFDHLYEMSGKPGVIRGAASLVNLGMINAHTAIHFAVEYLECIKQ